MSVLRTKGHRWLLTPALVVTAMVAAACGGTSTTTTTGIKTGGSLTFSLDEDVAGFNLLNANDSLFVLQEILDQVWPSVYIVNAGLKPVLNTDVITSATVTSTNPQTIVYNINPKATWSDGTPINAADFIYNWQSQSGNAAFKDKGNTPFAPVSTAGYAEIKSITSSNGGKTATVVFSKPFGDWQSLFSPMIPAHIAQSVGFNNGFQNFGPAVQVSGGPFQIQSYSKGQALVEVRNPHYWGKKANLDKIVFRFILDDTQQPPAISNGEVNLVNPVIASITYLDSVKSIPNFIVKTLPGLEFQHIDFNQSNPYLAKLAVRQAIIDGTNRADLINRVVTPVLAGQAPLNNRIYMPTQPQYQDTTSGSAAYDPAKAKSLLAGLGFKMGSDGYFQPNYGPLKGKDLSINISTTSGVPVRAEIEALFQSYMKAIGIKINIVNYPAATLFGTVLPKGTFDITQFAWVSSPFASGNQSIYCSYTNSALCGENWDHYANPKVDSLFNQAGATLDPKAAATLYNQIDAILWQDAVTMPLFQAPQLVGWSSNYANVIPNTSNVGVPWNANLWALKA